MAFNPATEVRLTISKDHKAMLDVLAQEQRRTARNTLEIMIERYAEPICYLDRSFVTDETNKARLPKDPDLQAKIDTLVNKQTKKPLTKR